MRARWRSAGRTKLQQREKGGAASAAEAAGAGKAGSGGPRRYFCISLPCCGKTWSTLSRPPAKAYDDFEVVSPKRRVYIYDHDTCAEAVGGGGGGGGGGVGDRKSVV